MKTIKYGLPALLLMAGMGFAPTASAAPVFRAGCLRRAAWLARRLVPPLVLLALAVGSSHASVSDGVYTLTKASALVHISEWDGTFNPAEVGCGGVYNAPPQSPCGEGAHSASIGSAASASASPDFGAINGNASAWASVGTGVYAPASMTSGGAVRSAWLDTYTVSSSTLPVNTPVTLTLRLDLTAAFQAAVADGNYSLCDGSGNSTACTQGYADFCTAYDSGCLVVVTPSLNAPSTLLTATYLLQTFVGVTGAPLTGQLVLNANANVRKPITHTANAEASALYYVDAPSGVTLTWASGHDYSSSVPVPLPAAVWLFGSALAGLVALNRRHG